MLNDGARITLGGTRKSYQQGSKFPTGTVAGPHLVYEYRLVRDSLVTGIYVDPVFQRDELIELPGEFVGGRYVKETYHCEDFNVTLV